MSTPDWKELERLWQDSPVMAPVKDIIARQLRRRWISRVWIVLEALVTIAGLALAVMIMTSERPNAMFRGAIVLLMVLLGGGVTLWARWPMRSIEHSVTSALDEAVHRTRVNVRLALASLWMVAAALVFTGMLTYLPASEAVTPARRLAFLGSYCMFLGVLQAGVIVYYLRRSRELLRLREIQQSLLA